MEAFPADDFRRLAAAEPQPGAGGVAARDRVIGAAEFSLSAEDIAEIAAFFEKTEAKAVLRPNALCGAAHWAAAGHWPAC